MPAPALILGPMIESSPRGNARGRAPRTPLQLALNLARRLFATRIFGMRIVAPGAAAAALLGCTPASDHLELVGSVERTSVELVAPVSEVIRELPVATGQHVDSGRTLAQLDPTLTRAEVASAEATVASATAALSVAEEEAQRAEKLFADRVIPKQQLDRARLALHEARARHREAHVRLEAWLERVNDLTLQAPAPGVLDQLPFEVGERVPAGAVISVLLLDRAPWVRVWIPERAVSRIDRDGPLEVRIDGFAPFRGRVVELAHEPEYTPHYALTERERVLLVYQARVAIEEAPESLRPGMPAEVRIPLIPVTSPRDSATK